MVNIQANGDEQDMTFCSACSQRAAVLMQGGSKDQKALTCELPTGKDRHTMLCSE